MKCRRLKTDDDKVRHVVWFGSYGKNNDGTAKFYNGNDKHDNYGTDNEAIADLLTQKLNVIKNELWYQINNGLPLFDKGATKGIFDAYIFNKTMTVDGIISIDKFQSKVIGHTYTFSMVCTTLYGTIETSY